MNPIPSGAVLHEEQRSVAMPTNTASNQFVAQLKSQARPSVGQGSPLPQVAPSANAPTTTTPAPTTQAAPTAARPTTTTPP